MNSCVDCTVKLNENRVAAAAPHFKRLLSLYRVDRFANPKYYPPLNEDREHVLRYFIFMVAIDHRTSLDNSFEGLIGGEFYHGADLLYRLGMAKYYEDPKFFSPEHMAELRLDELTSWLSVKGSDGRVRSVWDPEVRVKLLRDLGRRLIRLFGGEVTNLIRASNHRLKAPSGQGLIDYMKVFLPYSDPVEKKSYLFVKFISRRGLFHYIDPENSEVPVDNHLSRIALRLGFISVEGGLRDKLINGSPFTWGEDISLRLAVRKAYKLLSRLMNTDPLILDDILWLFGRHCCTFKDPTCLRGCGGRCRELGLCIAECPLEGICPPENRSLTEHNYRNTYYY